MFSFSEDKGALAKLVEAIKTNYNDRYEEVGTSILLKLFHHQLEWIILTLDSVFRSVVTGVVASWVPNPQLVSTSLRRQKPRNWQLSLDKLFGIKKMYPN